MKRLLTWSVLVLLAALPLAAQEAAKVDSSGPAPAVTAPVQVQPAPQAQPAPQVKVVTKRVDRGATGLQPLLEAHVGYGLIDEADDAIEFGASTELNVFKKGYVRLAAGVDYFSTETEKDNDAGVVPDGTFSDLSVYGDLRLKPFRIKAVAPYLGAGLGLHLRSNDYKEDLIADVYDGVGVCAQASLGVLVDGTPTGRWGVSGDVRSVVGAHVDRTAIRIGLFVRL